MKIYEILRVYQRSGIIPSAFDYDNAVRVGDFEGNDIWNIKSLGGQEELFAVKKDNNFVSHIMGIMWNFEGQPYFVLKDTNTVPEFQKQGLATSLYMFLIMKKKIKILSDDEQTQSGERIWSSIIRQHRERVSILDTETGEIHRLDDIPDSDLYIDGSKPTIKSRKYRLILENLPLSSIGIPETNYDVVKESIIYTDPNKHGIFD